METSHFYDVKKRICELKLLRDPEVSFLSHSEKDFPLFSQRTDILDSEENWDSLNWEVQ